MNEPEQIEIDREAWRRRLGNAGAPSETTDARIRREARRAVKPRASRWTLPVSLTAAVVLAVVLAQWQVEDERMHPLVDESQILNARPPASGVAEEPEAADAISAIPAAAAPAPAVPPVETIPESDLYSAPAPQVDLPSQDAARERDADELGSVAVTAAKKPSSADAQTSTPLTGVAGADVTQQPLAKEAPAAAPEKKTGNVTVTAQRRAEAAAAQPERSPEEWFAEIQKLRAAGKDAEADQEVRKLEDAYPGWLEQRLESGP